MLLDKRKRTDPDQRLTYLEGIVRQQGYVILISAFAIVICCITTVVIWTEEGAPDFDHIAVSLTIFQALFGIAALYGFWALRGLTQDRAEEVSEEIAKNIATASAEKVARSIALETAANTASDVAERVAEKEIREIAPSIILREVKIIMETFRHENAISDSAVESLVAAMGGKENGDGK